MMTPLGRIVAASCVVFLLAGGAAAYYGWQFYQRLRSTPAPVVTVQPEATIRLREGWTAADMADYLEREGLPAGDGFLELSGSPQLSIPADISSWRLKYDFLPAEADSLEGYLFPDTYRIYATSSAPEVIDKMLATFARRVTPAMRQDISARGKTLEEIIIMASLIEKEAPIDYADPENRHARLISGIFWNRLGINLGLQADATLSYIFRDNKPRHSGAELEVDSPYNTYRFRGLPPGPIANPGLRAIEAAIDPLPSDYYFFLTTADNEVIYGRNYDEHLRNINRYLR